MSKRRQGGVDVYDSKGRKVKPGKLLSSWADRNLPTAAPAEDEEAAAVEPVQVGQPMDDAFEVLGGAADEGDEGDDDGGLSRWQKILPDDDEGEGDGTL